MLLELADTGTEKVYIPIETGGGYSVPVSFFDKLSDYEFSGLFSELREFNNFDLNQIIKDRDIRRRKVGMPETKYTVVLNGSAFGDWLKQAGKKIGDFFKPTQTGGAPLIQPDGTITYQPQGTQDSGFQNAIKSLAMAFGYYTPEQPKQQSMLSQALPYIAIAGGGLLLYKLIKK